MTNSTNTNDIALSLDEFMIKLKTAEFKALPNMFKSLGYSCEKCLRFPMGMEQGKAVLCISFFKDTLSERRTWTDFYEFELIQSISMDNVLEFSQYEMSKLINPDAFSDIKLIKKDSRNHTHGKGKDSVVKVKEYPKKELMVRSIEKFLHGDDFDNHIGAAAEQLATVLTSNLTSSNVSVDNDSDKCYNDIKTAFDSTNIQFVNKKENKYMTTHRDERTTKWLVRHIDDNSLIFDILIQRNEVWSDKQKCLLIDSIIRDFPIPPIYTVNQGGTDIYECIDGKQRTTTIYKFFKDGFKLRNLKQFTIKGENYDLNGLSYSELPEIIKEIIDGYNVTVVSCVNPTPEEISDIMSRLNGGTSLSPVEKARISSANLSVIKTMAEHPFLTKYITSNRLVKYDNEDVLLKTVVLLSEPENPSLDKSKNMYKRNFNDKEAECIKQLFDKVQRIYDNVFEIADKVIKTKISKKTNMLAIINLAAISDIPEEAIISFIEYFFSPSDAISVSERYNEACKNGTNHAVQVKARNDAVLAALKEMPQQTSIFAAESGDADES